MNYSKEELQSMLDLAQAELKKYKEKNLNLDMSRGKPGKDQLSLTQEMLGVISTPESCITSDGYDCRNYGILEGIPEARKLFADIMQTDPNNVVIGGNSSLNLMYDEISRMMLFGNCDSKKPWCKLEKIKFLCPVPGYDRHFSICEAFGIEMINIPTYHDGPDMDMIEDLVSKDESIKGIWCVPKYSNPEGIVYSNEVVKRFANLHPAAKDFRIFWDNAYIIHSLYDVDDIQLNILEEAKNAGNPNLAMEFMSTSKITFPGSGVAVMASSKENIDFSKKYLSVQTIGYDKINQMRHVAFFKSAAGMRSHMKLHANIIRPKFEIVLNELRKIEKFGVAEWTNPRGGYFISVKLLPHCATEVYNLALETGVKLTNAGAPFPYHKDTEDRYLRIAPTYPSNDELQTASEILVLCIKVVCLKKLLNSDSASN